MTENVCLPTRWVCAGFCSLWLGGGAAFGADLESPVQEQLRQLQQQNERLQRQLQQQQILIDNLGRKVSGLENAGEKRTSNDLSASRDTKDELSPPAHSAKPFGLGKVSFSGEGGLAFFKSQSEGPFPKGEFRVDEARFFVEAPVWKDVYFFSEVNIATREEDGLGLRAGEIYLDFEDLSRLWNEDRQLNLRVGRFYIPFGEEYQVRNAIDNPLISHSLSDLWGYDQGLELYGSAANFHYCLAVQNGGINLKDYNSDKTVTARLGYDPANWLHLSASAMRTGALDTQNDFLSAIWFGNGFFRSLGANSTTFEADLFEADVQVRWPQGHLRGAGGYVHYEDNDAIAPNQRDVYYYYLEGVQHVTRKFYAAARWSQILAHKGFPVVGNGDFAAYLFDDTKLITDQWRLSLGLGYRMSENLLLKTEYTFDHGNIAGGGKRGPEDFFAVEVAFKF